MNSAIIRAGVVAAMRRIAEWIVLALLLVLVVALLIAILV
jgi:hypothetical protein